jgi:hypothetical protein
MVIVMILSIGAMMSSWTSRLQAARIKAETEAMLAAEAGYEKAIFWMSKQTDILGAIQAGGGSGNIDFGTSRCSYDISFADYIGARPVFKVAVTGISGRPSFTRIVDVNVIQETSGWAEGSCRYPTGTTSTGPIYFGNGETINMPLHINNFNDNPDLIDIWIDTSNGNPNFLQRVDMGESRKTPGGTDKYSSFMPLFRDGINFDQPDVRITNATAVQSKVNRFYNSTATAYRFTPGAIAPDGGSLSSPKCSAVQLEFFVQGGVGKVRIDPNCTVKLNNWGPSDYNIVSGSNPTKYQQYKIYAYHYKKTTDPCIAVPITDTYVTQTFGGYTSNPGGQIYVNGNVVIGGGEDANFTDINNMVVKGKITVVATGNIWVADSIKVDGDHDVNSMPTEDNPNILGLIAQGVIKVVDPGLWPNSGYPSYTLTQPTSPTGYTYRPIGIIKPGNTGRYLPNPTVVEAAITVGGGGWGAENVNTSSGRRLYSSPQDDLYVRGSITEVIRGIVGHINHDGYRKNYYIDTRLMSGILPGDIWFSGKYIPAPAGWHDFRPKY